MTSPSRRKRQTTARAPKHSARTPASLLALVLLATVVRAEQPTPGKLPPSISQATRPLYTAPSRQVVNDPQLQQTQYRTPGTLFRTEDTGQDFDIRFDLPGPELLFHLDSEAQLIERMRQERRKYKKEELTFPEQPVLSKDTYHGRAWPCTKMLVEPHYVCHGRLPCESLNFDRYGWEIGIFQPLVSAADFYKDVLLYPYHRFTDPCRCYECSAGKCLPGDPVPLLLYPPELSVSGAAAEVFAAGILTAIFP